MRAFVGPQQDRLTVADLLDSLEADFRLRGLKSLDQTTGHLRIARAEFGHYRAVDLTTEIVSRYIEERLSEEQAPATINRRTHLLAAAFRLAVRRRRLSSMPEIPKLREQNARQGFFTTSDFFAVLSHLGDQDVADITVEAFREGIEHLVRLAEGVTAAHAWGRMRYETLPYTDEFPWTRLFSPDYLSRVFGWSTVQNQWDGLLCEVDPPYRVSIRQSRHPLCLKWVSVGENAILKKSRGVTSLWGDAARQIPDGELGFVYIAYTEGSREQLADARTEYIKHKCQEWYYRWSVQIPLAVVNRTYPLTAGPGMPDFLETAIPLYRDGDDHFLTSFPTKVFII